MQRFGNCKQGARCVFSHSLASEPEGKGDNKGKGKKGAPNFWKISLCFPFLKTGSCTEGDNCKKAHSEAELQKTTLPCKHFFIDGRCEKGPEKCNFSHEQADFDANQFLLK